MSSSETKVGSKMKGAERGFIPGLEGLRLQALDLKPNKVNLLTEDDGAPMIQQNDALPFKTDDLNKLEGFTNKFQSVTSFTKTGAHLGNRVIPDIKALITDVKETLEKTVGAKFEVFKASHFIGYTFYFRPLPPASNATLVKMKLLLNYRGETGSELQKFPNHFTKEDILQASVTYGIVFDFVGDVKVWIRISNTIDKLPSFVPPTAPGVYQIVIQEAFMRGGRQDMIEHDMSTLSFSEVLLSMYPGVNMEEFLKAYQESDENIAIFIGKPGTGKTSLLKLILRETAISRKRGVNALYVKDRSVLHQASFWSNLSKNQYYDYLILDDLDQDLLPRKATASETLHPEMETKKEKLQTELTELTLAKEKNSETIVNQLLSFSDGLFQSRMKVLITTNLENSKIDPALVRPGRCFDILCFPVLTLSEAFHIWETDYNLTRESFEKCFKDVLSETGPAISQSLLASEAAEIKRNRLKGGYLIDKGVSVRNKYM
jgi:hypothetical protein